MCTPVPVGRRCVYVSVCMRVSTHVCAGGDRWGVPPPARPHPARWVSPQGVILCFGLCARGQVKTVLGVLHDFEERIQESEQSWRIGAWQVRHPCSIVSILWALRMVFSAPNQDSSVQFSSVQCSISVVSDSLRPHEPQHARPPCPSPTPGAYSNSRSLSW